MATTTILDFGLPANSHSGANQNRRPGVPAYLEQVVYAAAVDPNSPGAYRYDPDSSDPTLPESDPRSPRYEPPHLRHRPGDTWIIDRDRPRDPLDPGPYGAPDWYPDNRTGRHRRGELPDAPCEDEAPRSRPDRAHRPSPGPTSEGAEGSRPRRAAPATNRQSRQPDLGGGSGGRPRGPLRLRQAPRRCLVAVHRRIPRAAPRSPDRDDHLRRPLDALLGDLARLPFPRARVRLVRARSRSREPDRSAPLGGRAGPRRSRSPLAGTPFQGPHRTSPISPYLNRWERHFDERQAFREAVAL